ncbi:hypothetical protein [Nocardioides sp. R-C-SC26]|uniref:hypothetical protein n=1 Tax=Nocardioides sp. R-C-SC26 TaxID=2870414 RepID=UPI001E461EA3|nr:hypothetical protein [Nocardioides sp. R-C-SC26]
MEHEFAPTFDDVAAELRRLRSTVGTPSFAEIAIRVSDVRLRRGLSVEGARVARSTVYDVFRPGRRRLDFALLADVLAALEVDEASAAATTAMARRAVAAPAVALHPAPPATETLSRDDHEVMRRRPGRRVLVLLAACVALNLAGRLTVLALGLPLHLDMVGTAISAVVLGPWWGALVGATTNLGGTWISGPASIPFALVNVAGALAWGYGVRRLGLGRTLPRFFALCVAVAVLCSMLAAPIVLAYHGRIDHASADVIDHVVLLTHAWALSVFSSNLLISLADKLVSGFVALAVAESRPGYTARFGLGSPRSADPGPTLTSQAITSTNALRRTRRPTPP